MGNQRVTFPVDDIENLAVLADEPFFNDATGPPGASTPLIPDISKNLGTIFTVHFAVSTDAVISYTLNDSDYVSLLNGDFIQADSGHMFQITLREGDQFNIRSSVANTVRFCRVDLV